MNVCRRAIVLALVVLAPAGLRPRASAASADQAAAGPVGNVTFSKDVAPIFQRACQNCHRPGAIAPMSLLTYEEARPWARSIKQKVTAREMPPWFIDRHVGVRKFKDDPSLTDQEVATIATWVDGGAVRGVPADLPPPRQFSDLEQWNIGEPDLIITLPKEHTVPAVAPDWWGVYFAESGLTEDRYIQAVETKPGNGAREVVHHAITYLLDPDEGGAQRSVMLNEYALGKNGDVFPANAGRIMRAGTKIRFQMHYHSNGKETKDRTRVGIKFHPKGYVPKYLQISSTVGDSPEDLDIPAGESDVRHDGYFRLDKPTLLVSFQPHMHTRGKAMCVEAILPSMRVQSISCARFSFGWSLAYNYADDASPLLPAGTILHVIGWHDNSPANRINPDARNWAGYGGRTLDEMSFAWMNYYYLSDDDYQKSSNAAPGARTKSTVLALLLLIAAGVDRPAGARAPARSIGGGIGAPRSTFTKDVAPIVQRACQQCHRPGAIGPMSLLTYDDVRPWAKAIRKKVVTREMPPWFIDRRAGIQHFKNDPSLTEEEIATIAGWVDAGAPQGDPADAPAPRQFAAADRWTIGEPDLVVSIPPVLPTAGAESWTDVIVDPELKEDRYLSAVETLPGPDAARVIHHVLTYVVSEDRSEESFLNAYVPGGGGDVFPGNAGRLIAAGSKIRVNIHLHPDGEPPRQRARIGLRFHPKGVVPPHVQRTARVGEPSEALDIPAGEASVRHDSYFKLEQPVRLTSFQPHMHSRGKALCVEAILPSMRVEPINCVDRFSLGWQLVYHYADASAPLLPAGTILHVIGWHDNSVGNPNNPDPRNWVGSGGRTIDEMSFAWMSYYTLTDEEFSRDARISAAVAAGTRPRREH